MEEEILNSIKKHWTIHVFPEHNQNAMSKEIDKLTKDHYLKFALWLSSGNHPFIYWIDEVAEYFTDEVSDIRYTTEDLYNHWKENIVK